MGAWLVEQIVRKIEPDDPEERERYHREWRWLTGPVRAVVGLWRGAGLPVPRTEEQPRGVPADPPGEGTGRQR